MLMKPNDGGCQKLIDDIYDAGASPDRWPGVITSVASAAGAIGGVMFGFSESRKLVFEYNGSLDAASANIFKARHMNNAWVRGMAKRPVNQLVLSDEIIGVRELKRSDFYDEVLRPQHIAHGALSTLTFGSDVEIQFSVQKCLNDGDFRAAEINILRRLLPHIRRAMGVSLRLRRGLHPDPTMDSVTEQMSCPALTLTRSGELIDANFQAQRLGACGGAWLFARSGVRFSDSSEHQRLLAAMTRVIEGSPLQSLVLSHFAKSFDVVVVALKPPHAPWQCSSTGHPVVMLLLIRERSVSTGANVQLGPAKLLSPAEWRVAKLAAQGMTNAEITLDLGVSPNTVKTHLRRIYQKMNVNRQTELMLLLGRAAVADGRDLTP